MYDKFPKEVVELATKVVAQLNTNPALSGKYTSTLPSDDLLTRVCDYVQTLPAESHQRLLGITKDTSGEPKIKGSDVVQLADTIGRGFASYNKSGKYTDEEHRKALFNFRVLQQSKFNENIASLGAQIVQGLTADKVTLNYHDSLNPVYLSTILEPLSVETKDLAEQGRIVSLTIGMISAIAGKDTIFAAELKKKGTLPAELIVAIHESAVELAKDPYYSSLDQNGAIAAGKKIGKEIAREVAKYEFDNTKLISNNETIDTEAIKSTIVQGASKPNYERLQENKAQTKAFIEAHLTEGEPAPPNSQEIYSDVRTTLAGLRSKDIAGVERRIAYSTIIDTLEEARDNEFGIVWSRSEPHTDGSRDLIRDARNAQQISESQVSFALQAISSIRATEKVIDQEITDPAQRARAMTLLEMQMDKVLDLLPKQKGEQVQNINIKEFNFELVNILENAGVKESIKKIGVAKEVLSFDDPQYHVTTINRIPGRSELMIESETMLLGLTKSQKEQYEAIAVTPLGQAVTCKAHDMDWYNKLPDFDKALVKEYAGQIAEGNYVLPNQLVKQLIGLRNAYSKATFIHTDKGLELLDEGLHSSTVSFHGKGNKQEVVNGNIDQIRSFLPQGQDININTLNAPGNPSGIESEICKQISASQKSAGGYRSLTPFALWRIFPGNSNNNSGYEKALTEIAKGLEQEAKFTNLVAFLKTGKNEAEARKEVQDLVLSDGKLAKVLEHALEAKKLIDDSGKRKLLRGDTDPDNGNLSLSVRMRMISHEANKGALSKYFAAKGIAVDIPAILRHCKSGKDRTGLAEMETTRMVVLDRLGITDYYGNRASEIFKSQVNGGHTQFITSVNGGSTGTHGIKKDSKTALPNRLYKEMEGVILETASFNKFKVKKPRFHAIRQLFAGKQDDLPATPKITPSSPLPQLQQTQYPPQYVPHTQSQRQLISNPPGVVSKLDPNGFTPPQPYQYQPQNASPQYQSQASSPSGSKLTARDIMDSQTDSYQDFKTSSNVALGAVSLLLIGMLMGGGVIGIFLVVALIAGGFAMDSSQKMQQEKRQIATQMNIENDNKAYAMQKSSSQAPKVFPSVSKTYPPADVHRQRLEQSRTQPFVRQR